MHQGRALCRACPLAADPVRSRTWTGSQLMGEPWGYRSLLNLAAWQEFGMKQQDEALTSKRKVRHTFRVTGFRRLKNTMEGVQLCEAEKDNCAFFVQQTTPVKQLWKKKKNEILFVPIFTLRKEFMADCVNSVNQRTIFTHNSICKPGQLRCLSPQK